jgi:hypothetical protein
MLEPSSEVPAVEEHHPQPLAGAPQAEAEWEMSYPNTRRPLTARCLVRPAAESGAASSLLEVRLFYNDQLLTVTRYSEPQDARTHSQSLRRFLEGRGWVCTTAAGRQTG